MKIFRQLGLLVAAVLLVGSAFGADPSPSELWNAGRMDEAIKALNAAVTANPSDAHSYYMLSRAYYSLEDFETAIKHGEKAVQLKPTEASYQFWLGRAYGERADRVGAFSAMGLAKKTVAAFERAVKLNPNDQAARRALAEFYVEAPGIMGGGRDKARALADQVAATDPAITAWIRALIANKEKNWGDAETHFKNAVRASGNASWAWLELARFYAWGKRWNEFEAAMASALASEKKRPADYFNVGDMLLGTGRNFPAAVQALRKYLAAPKKDDEYPAFRAHYMLGQLFEKSGDKKQAAQEYRQALSLASGYGPAQKALKRIGS